MRRSGRTFGGRVALVVGVILLLITSASASAPASAGSGPHSGHYGVHTPIDNAEYAGAICHYTGGALDAIHLRRPILFAVNRTSGLDTQKVGWAFRIEYSTDGTAWTEYTNSPIVARSATDKVNAHFKSRTWHVAAFKTNYWRAINKFYWFYPDVSHVDGVVEHIIYLYQEGQHVGAGHGCPVVQQGTTPTPPPPGHLDIYGVHSLIDDSEYPGVTCLYNNTISDDFLYKIIVRQPIVFGFDRTGGIDTQTVGWNYTIQWSGDNSTWHKLVTSATAKATGSDAANAAWQPRSYTFPARPTHPQYRVLVRMFWYHPGASTRDGLATHFVTYYRGAGKGIYPFPELACGTTLG
jgi:hypothetical protein